MPVPDFSPGEVLTAAAMDSISGWLVKTQTVGTGVSSVEVTGAFSSDYDNYRITWTGGTLSGTENMRMILGATATGYYSQLIYQAYASNLAPLANVPDNNAVRWSVIGVGTTAFASVRMELFNPNRTTRTLMSAQFASNILGGTINGFLDNATAYTSFTLSPAAGTMTGGTIRVYGYRN
jgi:hypothetical protein